MARTSTRSRKSSPPPAAMTPEERQRQIAELAYLLAEQRHFTPGGELDDWLAAERAVDARTPRDGRVSQHT